MAIRLRSSALAVLLIAFALAGLSTVSPAPPPRAMPGGDLAIGAPTGSGDATLTDAAGRTYDFGLEAHEHGAVAGMGDVAIAVGGNAISLCSIHGSGAGIDWSTGVGPIPSFECGMAGGMSVAIDGCVADVSLHGFVHADHSRVTYLGTMTLDLHLVKGASGTSVEMIVHTPKAPMKLQGVLTGPIVMGTCA